MNGQRNRPRPGISVVIPVRNESRRLADCLNGILAQTVEVDEIIVIDSGSDDGTQEIATGFSKVKLVEIEPREFNHGETRNLGVSHASGEYVLFTVGDAWAVDEFWIERLMAGFVDDNVAGVCGSQVVAHLEDTNPVEWFRPQSEPSLKLFHFGSAEAFDAATPEEKREACSWDDVTAMYRMSALREVPFRKTVYGEDVFWAIDVLRSGRALAYQPGARVYHFHLNNYETTLKRTVSVGYLRYKVFGLKPAETPVFSASLRVALNLLKHGNLNVSRKLYWFRYNYSAIKAISKAIDMLNSSIESGSEALENLHHAYCGNPPLPLKPDSGSQTSNGIDT